MTGPSFNIRCRDGYIGVNALTEVQWQTACLFAGRPDMADDPRFGDFYGRLEPHRRRSARRSRRPSAKRSAQEVFEEAQQWRLPFGLVLSPAPGAGPAVARRAGVPRRASATRSPATYLAPRVPFLMSATPSTTTPAPMPGEHDAEVRREADAGRQGRARRHGSGDDPVGPLDGICGSST